MSDSFAEKKFNNLLVPPHGWQAEELLTLNYSFGYDALNELIKSGRITRNDMVAYLSGSFGEGGGTSFLEINNVGKVLDAGSNYQLPTFKE